MRHLIHPLALLAALSLTGPDPAPGTVTFEARIPGACHLNTKVELPPFDSSLGTLRSIRISTRIATLWDNEIEHLHPSLQGWGFWSWNKYLHNNAGPSSSDIGQPGDSFWGVQAKLDGYPSSAASAENQRTVTRILNEADPSIWILQPWDGTTDYQGVSAGFGSEVQDTGWVEGSLLTTALPIHWLQQGRPPLIGIYYSSADYLHLNTGVMALRNFTESASWVRIEYNYL